jgi:hypothetical protein
MDLTQAKLTRTEWTSIEILVQEDELFVLKMINEGCSNVNIRTNRHLSLIQYIKLDKTASNETCLYEKYFQSGITEMVNKYNTLSCTTGFTVPTTLAKDIKALKHFFSESLEKNKLQKTKDVVYDKEKGVVQSIPALFFNLQNRFFS